jgi:NhaP-type Na+/H+ or K+/H+ antiporter
MYLPLAILASFAFLYSIAAGRIEKTPFTGPIIFVSFGILAGPLGFGWLRLDVTATELRVLADLTLALLLFGEAANIDRSALEHGIRVPARMLLIGLPGVILLGWWCGWLIFSELGLWELAVLATTLAATDAALGKAVVTNKSVPGRIRETLNLESGLNDGLAVPFLLLFIAMARAGEGGSDVAAMAAGFFTQELGIGVVVGLVVTAAGSWLYKKAWKLGWMVMEWRHLPVVMLALTCFALAQVLHGSGFIAAFVGGLLFGHIARGLAHDLVIDTEGLGDTLGMLTWALFGSVVVPAVIGLLSWQILVYSLLSLTLVRMLPIMLSLSGSGERMESKLFLAWFGPRGLASIVFAVIVINSALPGAELISAIVVCTVILSVFAHGLTARPLANALAIRLKQRTPGVE